MCIMNDVDMKFTTILLYVFDCCRVFDRLMTGLISPTW